MQLKLNTTIDAAGSRDSILNEINRVTDWSPIGKEDSGRPGICWVWSSLTGI